MRKTDDKTSSDALPIIETGAELPAKRSLFPLYWKIEADALVVYDNYEADGISLLRAIQIAVAKYLADPKSGLWHREPTDYARPYIPNEIRVSGNISPAWTLPRAKVSHPIVKTLRARMSIKSR